VLTEGGFSRVGHIDPLHVTSERRDKRSLPYRGPRNSRVNVVGWHPGWTRLSTSASCQPEKPENSQVKTWGSASTLGAELAPPRCLSSNRRECAAWKHLRNVADTDEEDAGRCCQQNRHSELGQKCSGSPNGIRTMNLLVNSQHLLVDCHVVHASKCGS